MKKEREERRKRGVSVYLRKRVLLLPVPFHTRNKEYIFEALATNGNASSIRSSLTTSHFSPPQQRTRRGPRNEIFSHEPQRPRCVLSFPRQFPCRGSWESCATIVAADAAGDVCGTAAHAGGQDAGIRGCHGRGQQRHMGARPTPVRACRRRNSRD